LQLGQRLAQKVDPSDLVQECQVVVSTKIGEFNGNGPREFNAWLKQIVRHRLLRAVRFWREMRRDHRREQSIIPAHGQVEFGALSSATTSPSELLSQKETNDRLMLALSWSPEEDQILMSLRHFEGRDYNEIAELTGVTVNTVRQRYRRALRRLGGAVKLMDVLSERRIYGPQQEAIVRHCIWKARYNEIGEQLGLRVSLIARWIGEIKPLLPDGAEETT